MPWHPGCTVARLMKRQEISPSSASFAAVADEALSTVAGGVQRGAPASGGGIMGFFDGIYKGIVFDVGSNKGGTEMANAMYGKHATAKDRARASAAMKQFLVAGNKLPKGAPNLFG
jgi:hypothetical protein